MLRKRLLPSYSDGSLRVYRERDERTSFAARINPASLDDMNLVCATRYRDCGIRERDFEFAEQMGFSLSAKVAIPNAAGVDCDCKVFMRNGIYGISHIDRSSRELFLYLEGGDLIEREEEHA